MVPTFTPNVTIGCSDLEVTFSNSSTGGALNYKWNFDDGQTHTTTSQSDIVHSFVNRGPADRPFQVSLTATNAIGCSETSDATITVHPKVEADFSFTFDSLCTPFDVAIVNSSLNGSTFEWNFGQTGFWEDDTTTLKAHPEFQFTLNNPTDNDIGNYSISVHAYTDHASGHRCESDTSFPIEVYPRVVANFDVDVDEGCNALDVQFTNGSTGLGTSIWNFDDGSFSDVESPPKTFAHANRISSKVYNVKLTSTNKFGCTDIAEHDITVYPLVEAAFTISEDDGCTPLTTYINNSTVSPAYVYSWDFGDGQTSTDTQPNSVTLVNNIAPLALFEPEITLETSLNPAVYPIGGGCPETFSQQVMVYPHIFPNFTADLAGCHPLPVEFTNTTETIGGTDNATYLWSFGNGVTSNFTHFSQNYYNPSLTKDTTFTVWLRGYSAYGCTDSISRDITVYPKPQSKMELVSDYFACSPYEFEIQNSSEGKGFGTTLEFTYHFGDGEDSTTFSGANMLHPYRNLTDLVEPYTISLYVETEDACSDTSYQTIYVYPEVTAEFNFDPGDAACSPFLVTMENSSTNSSFYNWDFGDGVKSTLFEPSHRFVNNSMIDTTFNVILTATSSYNCKDTLILPLTVYSAPDANFTILPRLKVFPDAEFAFLNQTFPSSDGWTYTWTFGDGYGSNDKHPDPHTYETWGPVEDNFQYLVTLTVENDNCPDSHAEFLTLRPPVPIAYYESNENNYEDCAPLKVYFENKSEYYYTHPDSTAFLWDFGDGTWSNEREPIHTFQDSGFYNVSLSVYGDGGVSTFFWVFRVHENPIADFEVNPLTVILPDARVNIYNLSVNATRYEWDLGDGTYPTTKDVTHTYTDVGEYRISLTAYTDYGCSHSTFRFPAVWVKRAGIIRFPNAFVPSKEGPNGGYYDYTDYKNEVFHPIEVAVAEFKMMIFNRWGEQIFESNDIKIGWDGYYNGKLCNQDVYVYRAVGKYTNGSMFEVKGNVTLLR
ncbi:MAG: PKD domain-containing protein [Bacteroidales bacterium]|nr:PKD domain-containing protein [Bacteroidales bacterium]